MKACCFYEKNDLRVMEIEKPVPKADEVLIKVMACGVCGTDVHIFCGDEGCFPTPAGTVLGHEFAGIIEEVGTPAEVFDHPKSEKTRAFLQGFQESF